MILAVPEEKSDLTAQGIFGLEARELPDNEISDITASSQRGLNGTVTIDLLAVDPSRGLAELLTTPINPNEPIPTACNSRSRSRFVTTGLGDCHWSRGQQLSRPSTLQDWREGEIPLATRRTSLAEPGVAQWWHSHNGKASCLRNRLASPWLLQSAQPHRGSPRLGAKCQWNDPDHCGKH